jgi:hypothetical protein
MIRHYIGWMSDGVTADGADIHIGRHIVSGNVVNVRVGSIACLAHWNHIEEWDRHVDPTSNPELRQWNKDDVCMERIRYLSTIGSNYNESADFMVQ